VNNSVVRVDKSQPRHPIRLLPGNKSPTHMWCKRDCERINSEFSYRQLKPGISEPHSRMSVAPTNIGNTAYNIGYEVLYPKHGFP
jgi:hypothetical protein